MSESFEKWWSKYGASNNPFVSNETKGWCKAAHTAGLIRAAEICKSKHENMDSKLNYVAGWLDAEAAIRKEAGEMAHDDIPEDLQQSYPCECGGNIVKKGVVWECDTCDCSYLDKEA